MMMIIELLLIRFQLIIISFYKSHRFNIFLELVVDNRQELQCVIAVELVSPPNSVDNDVKSTYVSPSIEQKNVVVGNLLVSKDMKWAELEEKLGSAFLNHISEISIGLRTKKTSRLDLDSPDAPNPFTLGITLSSVKYYSIGKCLYILCTYILLTLCVKNLN